MTRVPVRWRLLIALLRRLPQGALSRGWGWWAAIRWPRPLQALVNRSFARLVGVDLTEAEHPPEHYPSLSAFFVRRLAEGRREWPSDLRLPGSPVDGVVGACGRLEDGMALQAKGVTYGVHELLAGPEREGADMPFREGYFVTIYLSPRHYHRIHAPMDGAITAARAVPGRLLPVNLPAVHSVRDLFPRNERLVVLFEGEGRAEGDPFAGRGAIVAVGAYNVGRISAAFDPDWAGGAHAGVTNLRERRVAEGRSYRPPLRMRRGEELMAFHLGSTVVLLLEGNPDTLPALHPELREGREIRMGTALFPASPRR